MADEFDSFAKLSEKYREGSDFKIEALSRGSKILIMAPHGGKIEPGTSRIAQEIAGGDYSLYLFEGFLLEDNRRLHITSAKFDEPKALKMLADATYVVTVHGRRNNDDPECIWIGGLCVEGCEAVARNLRELGFSASINSTGELAGRAKENICNRGKLDRGIQLEIPRSVRDCLMGSDEKRRIFAEAVRKALPDDNSD